MSESEEKGNATGGEASSSAGTAGSTTRVESVIEFRELAGGCACCSIKGDLVRALHATAGLGRDSSGEVVAPYDHVIIETTGLADPHPIANVLLDSTTDLPTLYKLHGVVTVVDAQNFGAALADEKPAGEHPSLSVLRAHVRIAWCV